MIHGIGTDIVSLQRIRQSLDRFGERFAGKILDEIELRIFQEKRDQVAFLAKRFAAKEAVSKALGTGMRAGVHFTQIGIRARQSGRPFVVLSGAAKKRLDEGAVLHLSISDEEEHAIAFVIYEVVPQGSS